MKSVTWMVGAAVVAAACNGGSAQRISLLEQRLATLEQTASQPVIVTPAPRSRGTRPGFGGDGYGGAAYGGGAYGGQTYAMEARFREFDRRLDHVERELTDHDQQLVARDQVEDEQLAGGPLDQLFPPSTQGGGRPATTIEYAVPIAGSPSEGPADAPVTWVAGIELSEPFSLRLLERVRTLRTEYGDRLRVVYKHFVVHRTYGGPQALTWCAAAKQGKLLPAIDDLRSYAGADNRSRVSKYRMSRLRARMIALGLDGKRFDRDVRSCRAEVKRDMALLASLGSTGTPVSYFNGYYVSGAQSEDTFRKAIEDALARAASELGAKRDRRYYDRIVKRGKTSP